MEQRLLLEIENLKRRLSTVEELQSVPFVEKITNKVIIKTDPIDIAVQTGTQNSTNPQFRDNTIPAGGATITTIDAPEGFLNFRYKGKDYLVPFYERT